MKKQLPHIILFLCLLFGAIQWQCLKSNKPGIPEDVRETLKLAGVHSPQLLMALEPYYQTKDSIKRKAIYRLIANMKANYSVRYHVQDTMGHRYYFNPMHYPDYAHLKHHWDSIERQVGNLMYEPDTFQLDYETLSGKFLIGNLEKAFKSWKTNPWSVHYSFKQFWLYILPYRCANEQVEPFRDFFQKRYGTAIDSLQTTHPLLVARKLNELINRQIDFKDCFNKAMNIQSIDSLDKHHFGNFYDIAVYKVKALRSFGIAAALDYTPFLADTNFGCAWATAFDSHGSEYYLFPRTTVRHLFRRGRMAKTYRRTFEMMHNSLRAIKKTATTTPAYLGHWDYLDISNRLEAGAVSFSVDTEIKYAYLAVFNDGEWHPVDWALPDSNARVQFDNMGIGIIYLPLQMKKGKLYRLGPPFVFDESRKPRFLIPDFNHTIAAKLRSTSPYRPFVFNKSYTLYVWHGNWQKIATFKGTTHSFILSGLPRNALFLISDNNIDFEERIFIVDVFGNQHFY